MTTGTSYADRLEHELVQAIARRRRKHGLLARFGAFIAVTGAVIGALVLAGDGSSPAAASFIEDQLSERSEVVEFVVDSEAPSYWRLTALADFDGTTSSSRNDVRETNYVQALEPSVAGKSVTQTFQIADLDGPWLPAAFMPVRVPSADGIVFEPETSTLTTSEASSGLVYTVESVLPTYEVARLRAANAPPTGAVAERNLALPADFPADLAQQAREVTTGAATRYDQAIALQTWFRGFGYDLSFSGGSSVTAMREFLAARRGYCQQFAGTFAAFVRVLGLPSRVAVGFTQGQLADDGRYHVWGKHAHAWPEIYFDGIGWVPFEPTPGRGNPAAENYTGVAAAQAESGY